MRRFIICGAIALACVGLARAQEARTVQCRKNADVRSVSVESGPGGCRVLYTKGKSPARELWHYKTHPEMCQTRAEEFVGKLQSMGLTCPPKS